MASGDLIKRIYGNFRGVDFRGEEINLSRSPNSLNMWKDYKETDSICTRPSLNLLVKLPSVYGIYHYEVDDRQEIIIHTEDLLLRYYNGRTEQIFKGMALNRSKTFIHDGILYIKDGLHYLQYDGTAVKPVVAFTPTTTIARKPAGGGTTYEEVNMLSPYRFNTFLGDGKSTIYFLDAKNLDDEQPVVKINGEKVIHFTFNAVDGTVTFNEAPPEPLTTGQDNVEIKFKKSAGQTDIIPKCTLLQPFDNRVFFSGNPDHPNTVWHCKINNPGYVSDLDYYDEGMDEGKITALVAGNNALWMFKEPVPGDTTVFYHNPITDAVEGKIYPSVHSNIAIGCTGTGINFNDDIVFFSQRGMEGMHGDVTTEQALAHRSSLVDARILKEEGYRDMILEEWQGYLLVFIKNKVYLADSKGIFQNIDHFEYEWFYWELPEEVLSVKTINGIVYVGTTSGIYTLSGNDPVNSYWETAIDKFNNPSLQKTTNKRGCVVEAKGTIKLEAKTDRSEWNYIDEFEDVTDYFVARVKQKKFKDLQLRFSSAKRFTLETATMEAFVGGYIKR